MTQMQPELICVRNAPPDAGAVSQAASAWAAYGGRDEGGVGGRGSVNTVL